MTFLAMLRETWWQTRARRVFLVLPILLALGALFIALFLHFEGTGPEEESAEEPNAEMQAMFEQMFAGYELIVVVNAPSRVKSHSLGELSSDGRTVRYSLPILDMQALKEETILTVVW